MQLIKIMNVSNLHMYFFVQINREKSLDSGYFKILFIIVIDNINIRYIDSHK